MGRGEVVRTHRAEDRCFHGMLVNKQNAQQLGIQGGRDLCGKGREMGAAHQAEVYRCLYEMQMNKQNAQQLGV